MRSYLVMRAICAGLWAFSALPALSEGANPPPQVLTTEQDHQNMMDQLRIKALRPGPSGNPADANSANYDEAKANPYPDWPEILRLKNGRAVTTADEWWKLRRPEIVEDFEREVIGRVPANAPKVSWSVTAKEREFVGFRLVSAQQISGHVDNAAYPLINVDIQAMLILPETKGPVPVLIMFGRPEFPNPQSPSPEDLAKIDAAVKAELVARDPSLKDVFARYPAYNIATPVPRIPESRITDLIKAGWGVAVVDPSSIQADNGAGLTRGIIGLVNKGQPRKPEDWGALRAWGWGASRLFDYLTTQPGVDAHRIGIEGVSRYGKAALVTMAFDQRFSVVLVGSSGEGGAKPHRRNFGEAVENLTGSGEYHWMAGNFLKYGAAESAFGAKTAKDLPVDSHELLALCAPRLVFVSYGDPAAGDASWLDQQGSFMATVAAGVTWKLLGAKDLGIGNDYRNAKKPPINTDLLEGDLAWRQHDGGHTDAPNITHFATWADRRSGRN